MAEMEYEDLTVDTTSGGVALAGKDEGHHGCLMTVEDDAIRVRWDGGAPTSSVGHLLSAGDQLVLDHPRDVQDFRAIRDASATGDATIRCTFSRRYR